MEVHEKGCVQDNVKAEVQDLIKKCVNLQANHKNVLQQIQTPAFQNLCRNIDTFLDKRVLSFESVRDILQKKGQTSLVSNYEQVEKELQENLQLLNDNLHNVKDVLHKYVTVVSYFGKNYFEKTRTNNHLQWLHELLADFSEKRCTEITCSYQSMYGNVKYPEEKTRLVFETEKNLDNIVQDTSTRLDSLIAQRFKEESETTVLEQYVRRSKAPIDAIIKEDRAPMKQSLAAAVVNALFELNKDSLQAECKAAEAGDTFIQMICTDDFGFLEKMNEICGVASDFIGIFMSCQKIERNSQMSCLKTCMVMLNRVYKAMKVFNCKFQTVILPEALRIALSHEEPLSAVISKLDDLLLGSGHSMVKQLEMQYMKALNGQKIRDGKLEKRVQRIDKEFKQLQQETSPVQSLLMAFNALFTIPDDELKTFLKNKDYLQLPDIWKRVDVIQTARAFQETTKTETTPTLLSNLFFIRRLLLLQEFLKMCTQFAVDIEGRENGKSFYFDNEQFSKPIKMFIADYVRKQVISIASKLLSYTVCLSINTLGVDVTAEIKLKNVCLEHMCKKVVEQCKDRGQFKHDQLSQSWKLVGVVKTAWERHYVNSQLDTRIELLRHIHQQNQLHLSRLHWLHVDLYIHAGRKPNVRNMFANRADVMSKIDQGRKDLITQQKGIDTLLKHYSQVEETATKRLEWVAKKNPACNPKLQQIEGAGVIRKEKMGQLQAVTNLCNWICHLEALKTRTNMAKTSEEQFLMLIDRCRKSCKSQSPTGQSKSQIVLGSFIRGIPGVTTDNYRSYGDQSMCETGQEEDKEIYATEDDDCHLEGDEYVREMYSPVSTSCLSRDRTPSNYIRDPERRSDMAEDSYWEGDEYVREMYSPEDSPHLSRDRTPPHYTRGPRRLSDLDEAKLNSCLDEIRNILVNDMPDDTLVAEIVERRNFNVEESLEEILELIERKKQCFDESQSSPVETSLSSMDMRGTADQGSVDVDNAVSAVEHIKRGSNSTIDQRVLYEGKTKQESMPAINVPSPNDEQHCVQNETSTLEKNERMSPSTTYALNPVDGEQDQVDKVNLLSADYTVQDDEKHNSKEDTNSCTVEQTRQMSPNDKNQNDQTETSALEQTNEPSMCTIKVRGPADLIVKHLLELYFENTKKSGGNEIKSIDVDEKDHVAFVTFHSEEDAQRVVDKAIHVINKQQLLVEMHKPENISTIQNQPAQKCMPDVLTGKESTAIDARSDTQTVGDCVFYTKHIIGKGSCSLVYEGQCSGKSSHSEGFKIAVKCIDCDNATKTQVEIEKLYRETKILEKVEPRRHKNIVGFYGSSTTLGKLYLAFEFCHGTLQDYVKNENKPWRDSFPPNKVNHGMASGVSFLHECGIVHRDLKPGNIFFVLKPEGSTVEKVVVGDFGSAKATRGSLHTVTGSLGTLGYIAPEAWNAISKLKSGEAVDTHLKKESDVFSLGLLFYFAASLGCHPYGHQMTNQICISNGTAPNFNQLQIKDFPLQQLLQNMLQTEPSKRPTSDDVFKHPALWKPNKVLKFFKEKSDGLEAMIKETPAASSILEASFILPHGNWMTDLPEDLRKYLKMYTLNGKRIYQGKGSSVRQLLRAIRNVSDHLHELPKNVQSVFGDYPNGYVEFWVEVCPKLLLHVHEKLSNVSS